MVDIEVLCSLHEAEIRRRNCAVSTLLSSGVSDPAVDPAGRAEPGDDGSELSLAVHGIGDPPGAEFSTSSASASFSLNSPSTETRELNTSNPSIRSDVHGVPPGQRLKLQRLTDGVSEALAEALAKWCSVVLDYNVYVAFFPEAMLPSKHRGRSVPFCLVRTKWTSTYLINVQVGFFSCPPILRQRIAQTIKWKIAAACIDVPTIEFGDGDVEDYEPEFEDIDIPEFSSSLQRERSSGSSNASPPFQSKSTSPSQSPPASPPLLSSQFPLPSPGTLPDGAHYVVKKVKPFGFPVRHITTILLAPAPEVHAPGPASGGTGSLPKAEGDVVHGLAAQAANGILDHASAGDAYGDKKEVRSDSALNLRLLRSYMRHHAWRWELPSAGSAATAMRLIRGLRSEEGFVLVSASGPNSCTWLREIKLTQLNKVDNTTKIMACIIQFSVTQLDDCSLQTELWMEPHYGYYHPSSRSEPLHSLVLFKALVAWLHCCDLHVISAIATFESIRDIDLEKVRPTTPTCPAEAYRLMTRRTIA
jgi:hypothetical protein